MTDPDADTPSQNGDALRDLLRAAHLISADGLATEVTARGSAAGLLDGVIYLADYEQVSLLPLDGAGVPPRQELSIDGTIAGLAYRRMQVTSSDRPVAGHRLWVPLVDGTQRLGVIEFLVETLDDRTTAVASTFADLVAELLVVKNLTTDHFTQLRRRKVMSLAAEIQWDLLPPLTCATDQVLITGALEPAYEIGGDTFDYAISQATADLLVLDSLGHGLPAALLASAAVGAYRHARRGQMELSEVSAIMDGVIAGEFRDSRFATALIARLHLDTGELRWVNAGHPPPLILRNGSLHEAPVCPPARPLGLQGAKPHECALRLEPGDQVVLYTDGIVEARSPHGEFFGEQRLADFVVRAAAAGEAAPETIRRLMRDVLSHQADQLQDDASIVLLEWRAGHEERLVP